VEDDRKTIPDEELMLRLKEGEADCFRGLVLRHQRSVINLAFRITGDRQEAEDIAQEVFLRVYRAATAYTPDAKFSTYLYRVTLNLSLNQVRKAKALLGRFFAGEVGFKEERETGDRADRLPDTPLTSMEKEEVKKAVRKAIRSLPKRQRLAIILSQYQELSYQEISEILGCSLKAVERLIHRGKGQLKKELASYIQKK
jgi:RNA polymerase sigma-70 factor (ECF subfamily)